MSGRLLLGHSVRPAGVEWVTGPGRRIELKTVPKDVSRFAGVRPGLGTHPHADQSIHRSGGSFSGRFNPRCRDWVPQGPAIISIRRVRGPWWFAFQPFTVEVDGVAVGKLTGGKTFAHRVSPGEHRVRVKFRIVVWSDFLVVSVGEGQELVLACRTDWRGYPSIAVAGPDDMTEMRRRS